MAKTRYDERTLKMMEEFMDMHEQGYTIAEIAAMYKITPCTIYERLGEIAKQNHVSRDSLLQVIHMPGPYERSGIKEELIEIDVEAFQKKLNVMIENIDEMIAEVEEMISDLKTMQENEEEE